MWDLVIKDVVMWLVFKVFGIVNVLVKVFEIVKFMEEEI